MAAAAAAALASDDYSKGIFPIVKGARFEEDGKDSFGWEGGSGNEYPYE